MEERKLLACLISAEPTLRLLQVRWRCGGRLTVGRCEGQFLTVAMDREGGC